MKLERIREKLKALIDARGISMRALSLRAGLPHNAVANIMNRNDRVNYGNLEKVLEVLGMPLAEFWESPDHAAKPSLSPPPGTYLSNPLSTSIPVPDCGTVAAGAFRLSDPASTQHFYAGTRGDEGSFVLTVSGNSMMPDYQDGEVIFLRRENIHLITLPEGVKVGVPYHHVKHLDNKDCVVLMKDEGSTFKRLKIDKGADNTYLLTLLPVNPEHKKTVIQPDHDVWIQGVCYKSVRRR